MKKFLFSILLILFLASGLSAQVGGQNAATLSNPYGGNLTASTTTCLNVAQACAWQKLPVTATTTTVTLSGTFAATVIIETSADGGNTFTQQSSQTAPIVVTFTSTSFTDVRVRCSAFTSGSIGVNIQTAGNQLNVTTGGSGGGFPVTTPVTVGTGGSISATGTGSIIATNGFPGAISCQGCKADLQAVFDATTTNNSATVTTSGGDFAFVSTDTGKVCEATTGGGPVLAHVLGKLSTPQASFTYTSAHAGSCPTANANASGTNTNIFMWATSDTAAMTTAYAAATPSGGVCGTLLMPVHPFFVDSSFGSSSTVTCKVNISSSGNEGTAVVGLGGQASMMVVGSNFNPATQCVGGSGIGCFFTSPGMWLANFTIWGLEYGNLPSTFNGKAFLQSNNDDNMQNILCLGWGAGNTSTSIGMDTFFGGANQRMSFDGCGNTSVNVSGSSFISNSFFGDSTNGINCSAPFSSSLNVYGDVIAPNPEVTVGTNCIFNSVNDTWVNLSGSGLIGINDNAGIAKLVNDTIDLSNGSGSLSAEVIVTGVMSALNTTFKSGSAAGSDLLINGTATYRDLCGNTYGNNKLNLFAGTATLISCPQALAQTNLTAQAANIGATTLYTTNSTPNNGVYTLTYDVVLVAAGTAGTLAVNLICPNGTATTTQPGVTTIVITLAAGSEASGEISCHAAVSSAIQYSVTGIVTPGALNYSLNLRLNPR